MDNFSELRHEILEQTKKVPSDKIIELKTFDHNIMNFVDLPSKIKNNDKYKLTLFKGINEFRPIQTAAFKAGILRGENLVISAPTSIGKNLPLEIAALKNVIDDHKKVIFIEPLRAITYEKKEALENEELNIKTAIFTGELRENAARNDIIYATSEMLAIAIKLNYGWLKEVGLIVIDECDMLSEQVRGATLEDVITYFLSIYPKTQIVMLSATLSNGQELSRWIGGKFIETSERPIPLNYIIETNYRLDDIKNKGIMFVDPGYINKFILTKPRNTIIATFTRKDSINLALNLSLSLKGVRITPEITKYYRQICAMLQKYARYGQDKYTRTENKCIYDAGIAFHNAGLIRKQREVIEEKFRKELIRIIVCTPTLERGVNLPVDNIVFSNFDPGNYSISRFRQMSGRAGRPGKSSAANVYIQLNEDIDSLETIGQFYNKFISSEPERTLSCLGRDLVKHLAYFVSAYKDNINELLTIINKSLFAVQFGTLSRETLLDLLSGSPELFEIVNNNIKLTNLAKLWINSYLDLDTIKAILSLITKEVRLDELLSFISRIISRKNREAYFLILKEWISGNSKPLDNNEAYIGTGDFKDVLKKAVQLAKIIKEIYLEKKLSASKWILGLDKAIKYGLDPEVYGELCSVTENKEQAQKLFEAGISSIDQIITLDLNKIQEIERHKTFLRAIAIKSNALKIKDGDSLISVHELIDYNHCPFNFLLRTKNIKASLDKFIVEKMQKGSSIHRHIKNITKLLLRNKDFHEYLDNIGDSYEKNQVLNFLSYIRENKLEIIDTEKEIVSESLRLDGIIDSITVQEGDIKKLIELKSGKFTEQRFYRDQLQLKAYGLIAKKEFDYVPKLTLLYLEDKIEKNIILGETEINQLTKKINEAHALLREFNALNYKQGWEALNKFKNICTCKDYEHDNCICRTVFKILDKHIK